MAISETEFEQLLQPLRSDITAFRVYVSALRLCLLARKAGFRPDQPRVPGGNPDGGQWTDDPGWIGVEGLDIEFPLVLASHHGPPKIPDRRPPTVRERNRFAVALARYLVVANTTIQTLSAAKWVWEHAHDRIIAYREPPRSLEELRQAVANPRPGFDNHHIVEQTPARQDGFPESRIRGPDNVVRIPTYRHWEITAWYATKNPKFGGLSPRDFLRGQSWETRMEVGKEALILHGVLKP